MTFNMQKKIETGLRETFGRPHETTFLPRRRAAAAVIVSQNVSPGISLSLCVERKIIAEYSSLREKRTTFSCRTGA